MKKKIICMSMIGLLLFTGVASFPVLANKLEQNTPVVKSEAGQYADITIEGFIRLKVTIFPNEDIKNNGHKYSIRVQFNDDDAIVKNGFIYKSTIRYYLEPLPYLRFWLNIPSSKSGTVTVTVKIMEEDPYNPHWYKTIQEAEKTGSFSRFFISI